MLTIRASIVTGQVIPGHTELVVVMPHSPQKGKLQIVRNVTNILIAHSLLPFFGTYSQGYCHADRAPHKEIHKSPAEIFQDSPQQILKNDVLTEI